MSLVRWDPLEDLSNLREQMNRFFDQTFRRGFFAGTEPFGPRIDLYQTDQEVVAVAEIPGVQSKDDVEVALTNNTLILRGEFKRVHDVSEENILHSERFFGSFSRNIPLPAEIKPDESTASYKNGLLEIRMPKTEKGRRNIRRIPIQ